MVDPPYSVRFSDLCAMRQPATTNKRKIINDPVYGFVTIPYEIIYDILEHPWFQRLRRIQQLGLTNYVYPGALHTRFHHTLGALHLMTQAIDVLRSKGHEITEEEGEAVSLAIFLHDIGHGPFSHTLEKTLIPVSHEAISLMVMRYFNRLFPGRLDLAMAIFTDEHPKPFLHQLVSSQLDMDRMDYLNRDSFFTGVHEGVIGYDRIIKMLNVQDGELVVEAKGIYSIEKFLIARRLMYWQVYLHKTVLSAEQMLLKILERAIDLSKQGRKLEATPALDYFLHQRMTDTDFAGREEILEQFMRLDDYDVFAAIKRWTYDEDKVLSTLCRQLVARELFRVRLDDSPIPNAEVNYWRQQVQQQLGLNEEESAYFVFTESTSNHAYSSKANKIKIQYKDGTLQDVASASDQLNISVLSQPVVKYYLCHPKNLTVS